MNKDLEEALRMFTGRITGGSEAGGGVGENMIQWAKQNHGWDNQTGRLEASIAPLPITVKGEEITFGIVEGMNYAQYVERRKDKGVLQPTYEHFAPEIQSKIAEVTAAWAGRDIVAKWKEGSK
ncbi:hypothetical protein AGMMS49940_15270 [Spirochaetia bacterium]|nr:hypothetical protein AGMMS49940_15270 [Spirochaetia bacterium]